MQSVQVLTGAWYGDREVDLTFPDDWEVNVIEYEKHPVLTQDQLRQAFHEPIGSPRIAEIAQGQNSAVIICDDLTRPTPSSEVIPFILEELQEGGISEENIIFFMGFGCHRSMKHADLVKKLDLSASWPISASIEPPLLQFPTGTSDVRLHRPVPWRHRVPTLRAFGVEFR